MAGKRKKGRYFLLRWVAAAGAMALVALALVWMFPGGQPDPTEPPVEPVPGIDVSSHQGPIDWQAVAEGGVEFAMIRLGYRTYGDGTLCADPRAAENLQGARDAGLMVGAYVFSQALTPEEARQEAALALEVLDGMGSDLPIAFDWEYVDEEARTGDMDPAALLECVHAFCGTVQAAGYEPMVYFNRELSRTLLDLEEIGQYPFWYARYGDVMDLAVQPLLWQYTDQGRVPGIGEDVDLNWYYPA